MSIIALVFGYKARTEIAATGQEGRSYATAGIIMGWIGVVLLVLVFLGAISLFMFAGA